MKAHTQSIVDDSSPAMSRTSHRQCRATQEYYYLPRETLKEFVPPGGTFADLRALLEERGALLTDDRLPSKQVRMSRLIAPDLRVYQLSREVIDGQGEPEDDDEFDTDPEG